MVEGDQTVKPESHKDPHDPDTVLMDILPPRKLTFEEIHCHRCPKSDTCKIHKPGMCRENRK